MEPTTRLWLLGTPHAEAAGQPVQGFESRKALVLLGYLASHTTAIPRGQLAALFWPDLDDERARSNLRRVLHNLSNLLPGCLLADRQAVQLHDCWIDIGSFETLVTHGTLTSLAAAAELYRSAFLDGLYLDDCPELEVWLTQQREHWHERAAHALTRLTARAHERQEWAAGLRSVDRLLALDPWREAAHQDRMRLLALSGQRDSALAQYEICRRVLTAELGIDPSPETIALYEQIRDGLLTMPTLPAPTTAAAQRLHVPIPPTPLLGRAEELAQLTDLLAQPTCRLLTLLGTGGVGKTRLALELAAQQQARFGDGVYFVDLATIYDPALVTTAIARTLAVRGADDQPLLDSVKNYLRNKHVLLLLDNFEQVITAAGLVADLLAGCPDLKVLATSRQELHLRGEQVFAVPPLALPDRQTHPDPAGLIDVAAVALFVERARHRQPDFALTAENAAVVAEICQRLDGLPLAIELAAARIRLFSPEALVLRLSNRLDLLTRGPHDLPSRQQTLQNTLDWSYNLLESGEQKLFAYLAVFAGSWTLAAAEGVCGDLAEPDQSTLDALQSLFDKQLIYQKPRLDGESQFTMLETIREYARARLAQQTDAALIRQRHAAYYLAQVELAVPAAQERLDSMQLAQIDAEYDNQLAALQWMLEQKESEGSLRLCNALVHLWDMHGYLSEGRYWLRAALALPDDKPSLARADVLELAGRFAVEQGDWSQAEDFLAQALSLGRVLGDTRRIAQLLRSQGWLALMCGAYADATGLLEESVSLYRRLGDQPGIARVLGLQGQVAYEQCAFAQAVPLLTESLAISRALDESIDMGWSINKLGLVALYQGNISEADRLLTESLVTFTTLEYKRGIAWALGCLGWVRLRQAAHARAAELFVDSLTHYRELGEKRNIAFSLERLASIASAQGQALRAARLFGAASALRRTCALPLPPADQAQYAPYLALLHAALNSDDMALAWAEGAALSTEQAIADALQLV